MDTTPRKTLAVTPTYNEREALPALVAACEGLGFDLLVVDDSSPDGTAELARELAATRPWLKLLVRPGKDGLGSAYRSGFAWALANGYERIVQMDADLSHPPAIALDLLAALDEGAELAIGSRFVPGGGTEGWPLWRKLQSQAAILPTRALLHLPYHDLTGGFKAWTADALRTIEVESTHAQGYAFQIETTLRAARAGLPIVERPFVFTDRAVGVSKLDASVRLEGISIVLKLALEHWQPGLGRAA